MNQPDAWEFSQALVKEVKGYVDKIDWELIPFSKVPEWNHDMHRKRDLVTNQVTKYKAQLNFMAVSKN